MWVLVNGLSHQEGQLVGVLAGSRDSDGSRPVVVEVAHFVGQALHVVRLQSSGVPDHVVVGGGHCSLPHRLRHQEEVIPYGSGDGRVDNGPWARVV